MIKVPMSKYQYQVYSYFHEKEKNKSSYKIYTRSSSNFVFPSIKGKINAFSRPRPNMFSDNKQYSLEIKKYLTEIKRYLKKHINKNDIIKNFQDCIKNYRSNIIFYIFTNKKTSNSLKLLYNFFL